MCDAMNVIEKLNQEFDEVQNQNQELKKELKEKDNKILYLEKSNEFRRVNQESSRDCFDWIMNNFDFLHNPDIFYIIRGNLLEVERLNEEGTQLSDNNLTDPEGFFYEFIEDKVIEICDSLEAYFE